MIRDTGSQSASSPMTCDCMEQNAVQEPRVTVSTLTSMETLGSKREYSSQRGEFVWNQNTAPRAVPRSGKTLSGVIHDGFEWRAQSQEAARRPEAPVPALWGHLPSAGFWKRD